MAKAPCKKCYRSIRMQKARGRAGQLSLFGEIKDYEPQCAIICIASRPWDFNLWVFRKAPPPTPIQKLYLGKIPNLWTPHPQFHKFEIVTVIMSKSFGTGDSWTVMDACSRVDWSLADDPICRLLCHDHRLVKALFWGASLIMSTAIKNGSVDKSVFHFRIQHNSGYNIGPDKLGTAPGLFALLLYF